MYEDNTQKSIDWKGLFLKVVIAFLVVLIAIKGYTMLKGNDKKNNNEENQTQENTTAQNTATFTANMEKLRNAGKNYFDTTKDALPKTEGSSVMVSLNELINKGYIAALSDEDGKTCDGEGSYVTATLENKDYKLKANLVCGNSSSYSLVFLGEMMLKLILIKQ